MSSREAPPGSFRNNWVNCPPRSLQVSKGKMTFLQPNLSISERDGKALRTHAGKNELKVQLLKETLASLLLKTKACDQNLQRKSSSSLRSEPSRTPGEDMGIGMVKDLPRASKATRDQEGI